MSCEARFRGSLAAVLPLAVAISSTTAQMRSAGKPSDMESKAYTNSIGMKWVLIKAGRFTMGSPAGEEGHVDNEGQHEVTISRDFWMGVSPVTVGQFRRFVEDSGYKTEAETDGGAKFWDGKQLSKVEGMTWKSPGFQQDDRHPVVVVSWNDAKKFCEWLGKRDGKSYRLPTEAEWEFAARAGTKSRFHTGDSDASVEGHGNVGDRSLKRVLPDAKTFEFDDGFLYTSPVATFKPNGNGLYDMIGNVWCWCEDWYGKYPNEPVTDPTGPINGRLRVLRGGSWVNSPSYCRSAVRYAFDPDCRYKSYGFRVCLVLP